MLAIGNTEIFDGTCQYYSASGTMYYQVQLLITLNSQDVINALSNVTILLRVRSVNSSYYTYGFTQVSIIEGTTLAGALFDIHDTNVWHTFGSRTIDLPHNSDGTLTNFFDASFTTNATSNQWSLKSGGVGGTVELATIPRTSAIATFDAFTIGNNIPIGLTRYSGSFTDDISLMINGIVVLTRTSIAASTSIVPTTAEIEAMIVACVGVYSTGATLTVTTKSGATVIGTSTKTVFASLKSGFIPYLKPTGTIDAVRCDSNGAYNLLGAYVKFIYNIAVSSLIYTVGQAEPNTLSYQIKFKKSTDTTYTSRTVVAKTGLTANSYEIVSGFPVDYAYDIQFNVIDKYNTFPGVDTLPFGEVAMMLGKKSVSIGKVPSTLYEFSVDAAGQMYQNGGKKVLDESSSSGGGNPTLYGGFGDMGGTSTAGVTFTAPGHAMAIKTGNTFLVVGHCKLATVNGRTGSDFHTGINIAKLKAILGITETLIPSTHLKNSLNIFVDAGTRYTATTPWNPSNPPYAYGLSMETDDNLNFYVGRYYDANGNFGGWPLNQQVYDSGNTWDFVLTFTTA